MTKPLLLVSLLFAMPIFADVYSVGYLTNTAGSPIPGEQQLTIYNVTGPSNLTGCEAYGPPFSACSNLTFTNWTLTVDYTSDYYSPGAPGSPASGSLVFTDGGSGPYGNLGDINAGSSLALPGIDLCGGSAVCANPYAPDTQITSVQFTGQISPASFTLCDNSVPTCSGPTATTFFANPNFSLTWNASSPPGGSFASGGPYVDDGYAVGNFDNFSATSPDITVTDQNVLTPEPNGYVLSTALLPFLLFLCCRLKYRSRIRY